MPLVYLTDISMGNRKIKFNTFPRLWNGWKL